MTCPAAARVVGWQLVSEHARTGRVAIRPRDLPRRDPVPPPAAADVRGVLVETTRAYPPAASLTGMAYLRLLAGHRRRVRRELAEIAAADRAHTPGRRGKRQNKHPKLPFGRLWADLVTVRCAGCPAALLGWCEEYLRAVAEAEGRPCRRYLPPPVAARVNDRPYCRACAPATY